MRSCSGGSWPDEHHLHPPSGLVVHNQRRLAHFRFYCVGASPANLLLYYPTVAYKPMVGVALSCVRSKPCLKSSACCLQTSQVVAVFLSAACLHGVMASPLCLNLRGCVLSPGHPAADSGAQASVGGVCFCRFPGCRTDQDWPGQRRHDLLRGHADGAVCVRLPSLPPPPCLTKPESCSESAFYRVATLFSCAEVAGAC